MASEKVALVTAGGSGMGAAAARRLAADGFRVAILSSSGKGEALAGELGGIGFTFEPRGRGQLDHPAQEPLQRPAPEQDGTVAALEQEALVSLVEHTESLGMTALVEVTLAVDDQVPCLDSSCPDCATSTDREHKEQA